MNQATESLREMEGNRNGNGGYPLKCLCGAVTPLKCLCGAVTLKTPWTHNLVASSSSPKGNPQNPTTTAVVELHLESEMEAIEVVFTK